MDSELFNWKAKVQLSQSTGISLKKRNFADQPALLSSSKSQKFQAQRTISAASLTKNGGANDLLKV